MVETSLTLKPPLIRLSLRAMKVDVATLPNWEFDIVEVSPSFYRLKAVHNLGPTIEMTGQ